MRGWLLVAVVACGSQPATHDASPSRDADPCTGGCGPSCPQLCDFTTCSVAEGSASCIGSAAASSVAFAGGVSSQTLCNALPVGAQHTCTAGCALQESVSVQAQAEPVFDLMTDIAELAPHPEVLCAETPEARVGDTCAPPPRDGETGSAAERDEARAKPCLPTRAPE